MGFNPRRAQFNAFLQDELFQSAPARVNALQGHLAET
jgi:hypothetical protein